MLRNNERQTERKNEAKQQCIHDSDIFVLEITFSIKKYFFLT